MSSYAAPPKMNDYLPKATSAGASLSAAYPQAAAAPYSSAGATPYQPPQPSLGSPLIGVQYHGAPANPRGPLSPQIVENHSPQPYHQQQAGAAATQQQPSWQQRAQSNYQQSQQSGQQQQQSTTTTTKSIFEQSSQQSSGVKEMRNRFSQPQQLQQSQTLPRNFLAAPSQTGAAFNQAASPTFDGPNKVRNASPVPFGRHATTTSKSLFENSYTKTQFHNQLYQPPKGPLQHSFINNRSSSSSTSQHFGGRGGGTATAHEYPQQPQQQQHYTQPQQYESHQPQQQYEHVSRSHFRSPAQTRFNTAPAPVFRNVTNRFAELYVRCNSEREGQC